MRGPLPDIDEDDYLPKPSMLLSIDFGEELTEEDLEDLDDLEIQASVAASIQRTRESAPTAEERALWADVARMLEEDNADDDQSEAST